MPSRRLIIALIVAMLLIGNGPAFAQYFGRNKVQHREFDFKVLSTEHFDVYYYPGQEAFVGHVARMAERWYARLNWLFGTVLTSRQPLILYASSADFRQTNTVSGDLGEGTGGVTEGLRRRIVMPSAGPLAGTDHVLGHELVHAFQYDMGGALSLSESGLMRLPLWMVEGLAEYLSIGSVDPQTAMWLRDAVVSNTLPTVQDLGNARFFPYRFGHAFWAYIAGRWDDSTVMLLFNTAVKAGDAEQAIRIVLGMDSGQLSRRMAREHSQGVRRIPRTAEPAVCFWARHHRQEPRGRRAEHRAGAVARRPPRGLHVRARSVLRRSLPR